MGGCYGKNLQWNSFFPLNSKPQWVIPTPQKKHPYSSPWANITAVVKMVVVQKATDLSVWRGKFKHYQRNLWICWISHLLLWGADNLSNNDGNNADKMEYCISKCTQYYMISKWLSPETICHIGTMPAVPLLPDFLHSCMASLLPQWRAVVFLLLPAGWQLFCLAELADAVAPWSLRNERTAGGRKIS